MPYYFLFCRDAGFIELLRQSEKDLSDKWSFDKSGGYTIIARTSLALPNATAVIEGLSSVSQRLGRALPSFDRFYGRLDVPSDLREAIAIVRYMWSRHPKLGPHNDTSPKNLCPLARLDLLEQGQWAAQCGDIQYIFVNLAAVSKKVAGVR